MTDRLATLRAKRDAHEAALPVSEWYTPAQLATRWHLSLSTVRQIPASVLPFKEFGGGEKLKRRRYHAADVAAYEAVKVAA